MKILLSVKPEYTDRILDGSKRYEYRRRLAAMPISSILLYATEPVGKVVGEVKVTGTVSDSPTKLWEQTKKYAGITRERYRLYFHGKKKAHAYVLGDAKSFIVKKSLAEYRITSAPQSFVYIDDK